MKSNSFRRMTTRVAIAGAIALIPLAAVTIPASADVPVQQPGTGDVAWPRPWDNDGGWWNHDRDDWRHHRDRDDWRHDRDDWRHDRDDWNHNWRHDNDDCWWRNMLPGTGSF